MSTKKNSELNKFLQKNKERRTYTNDDFMKSKRIYSFVIIFFDYSLSKNSKLHIKCWEIFDMRSSTWHSLIVQSRADTDGICMYTFMYIQRPACRSTRKVVYSSSFNYLINSVSSIIFARVIKPQAKVNNLRCTFSSRSEVGKTKRCKSSSW